MEQAAPQGEAGKAMIELRKVSKWYNTFQALKEVSLTVRKGERVVICGPSGSGKSTLIRCINHLEPHQQGQILVEGVELTDAVKNIELIRRDFPFFNHFDGYILSYEVKAMKPAAKIYEALENTVGKRGEEILYIDDRPENIVAGATRDWRTILHESSEKTRAALERFLS